MKEYKVETKQEAIALALELTEDKAVQQSAIEMLDFMPTFIMTEEGSYNTLMLVGAYGPIGHILFSEVA
jgi:hypothetical protein